MDRTGMGGGAFNDDIGWYDVYLQAAASCELTGKLFIFCLYFGANKASKKLTTRS